jgi:hypothetical protein
MKKYLFLMIMAIFVSVVSMAQKRKKSENQGITGFILWKVGNQMPSPDMPIVAKQGSPVEREVYVYALTNQKQTDATMMPFFSNITTKLIIKTKSGKDGKLRVRLPVGYYSLFVKEEKGLYANQFDDAMNIFVVRVSRRKWSNITFLIDYQSAY